MHFLDKTAETVFHALIEGLKKPGDAKKIDNTDGTFMPVHVEIIDRSQYGNHVSIAHYYEQNGDLMKDPEMTFLASLKRSVLPMTFEQDGGFPICQVAMEIDDSDTIRWNEKLQSSLADFANTWMVNIKDQQHL
jgi:hypothetical protein